MKEGPVNIAQLRHVILMMPLLITSPLAAVAAASLDGSVGGSVGVASDYLVRGISRSQHEGSVQADAHIAFGRGFDAGIFAASVQIAPHHQRDAEVSAFAGFATDVSDSWRTRVAVSHYSYPWNSAGSEYDYDELSLDVAYQAWLTFSAVYSPNAPRYLAEQGVVGVTAKSAEISVQTPLSRQFFLTGGLGYAHLAGSYPGGYTYWSVGGVYALGPVSISLLYASTSSEAQQLYYDAAAHNRLVGTVLWRF